MHRFPKFLVGQASPILGSKFEGRFKIFLSLVQVLN